MKTYHGYDASTAQGQKDLFYGGRVDPNRIINPIKSYATENDIKLLNEIGVEGLKTKELFGVIDRLKKSGKIA